MELGVPLRELGGGLVGELGWVKRGAYGTSGVTGSEGGGGRLIRVGALADMVRVCWWDLGVVEGVSLRVS